MQVIGRLSLESGMVLTMPIQMEELFGLPVDSRQVAEIGVFPDVPVVILVETFHKAIALGMIHRRKDQFCTYGQR